MQDFDYPNPIKPAQIWSLLLKFCLTLPKINQISHQYYLNPINLAQI